MCGILGIFSPQQEIDENSIKSALNSLYHRGSDHQSHWLSKNKKIAPGHTRLSIIDLHTGDQPISDASNSTFLFANGEYYDF